MKLPYHKMTEYIIQHEEVIFEITQEYLNKNRYFNLENIIPFINVRLKKFSISLTYDGIREILKSLIKKKIILERSKLTKKEILNNTNRKIIYDFITNNPGVYFNRISRELKLSNYILAWHIKMLINFEFIKSSIMDNHEIFFKINIPSEEYSILYILSKEKAQEVINYLKLNQDGCYKTQICKDLNMHSNTVSKYIQKLENLGIIIQKKDSNRILYFLTDKIERYL